MCVVLKPETSSVGMTVTYLTGIASFSEAYDSFCLRTSVLSPSFYFDGLNPSSLIVSFDVYERSVISLTGVSSFVILCREGARVGSVQCCNEFSTLLGFIATRY